MSAEQAIRENQVHHPLQEILGTLGTRIRSERQRKKLSQERFASVCGLHRTEMGRLERGKTIPRLDTLLIVSEHLAVSLSELLQGLKY
jgi:transcriptional regulator with XRE-family HTH domain